MRMRRSMCILISDTLLETVRISELVLKYSMPSNAQLVMILSSNIFQVEEYAQI